MSNNYLQLPTAPTLVMRYPDCDACCVEVTNDGDGWVCPSCGTAWDVDEGEDKPGILYEEWSGEAAEGPVSDLDNAWSARF